MQDQAGQAPAWANYIPFVIIPVVLLLRARRMTRIRPLKVGLLWVVPAIYSLVVLGLYVGKPPHGTGWLVCAAALAIGAALGWQRGKTVRLHLDPDTQTVQQRGSMAGLIFLVVLIGVKAGARSIGSEFHFDVSLATDALAALVLGMIAAMRAEMFLRARSLIAA